VHKGPYEITNLQLIFSRTIHSWVEFLCCLWGHEWSFNTFRGLNFFVKVLQFWKPALQSYNIACAHYHTNTRIKWAQKQNLVPDLKCKNTNLFESTTTFLDSHAQDWQAFLLVYRYLNLHLQVPQHLKQYYHWPQPTCPDCEVLWNLWWQCFNQSSLGLESVSACQPHLRVWTNPKEMLFS
jgi:hypothetical protein